LRFRKELLILNRIGGASSPEQIENTMAGIPEIPNRSSLKNSFSKKLNVGDGK
jgi:hypothetical protein